jgi:hypothetical protein
MFGWLQHLFTLRAISEENVALKLQLADALKQNALLSQRISHLESENKALGMSSDEQKRICEEEKAELQAANQAIKDDYQKKILRIGGNRPKP